MVQFLRFLAIGYRKQTNLGINMDARLHSMKTRQSVLIGAQRLTIEDVLKVAKKDATVSLSTHPEFALRIRRGAAYLQRLLADNGT